jgi:FG-GAP-like repeat
VLLNRGDGTFAAPQLTKLPLIAYPQNIVTADFNGDGKLDLAIGGSNSSGEVFQVWLGNGDGTFSPLPTFSATACNISIPFTTATADFNHDGRKDLLCSGAVFLGNGDGTFNPLVEDIGAQIPVVGDINGDGLSDVLSGDFFTLGNGDGTFQNWARLAPLPRGIIMSDAVGDLNGDGKLDVALAFDSITGVFEITTLLNKGNMLFHRTAFVAAPDAVPTALNSILIADYNGDGRPDVILPPDVFLNKGKGKFAAALKAPFVALGSPNAVATADLNGDGKADLLAVELASGQSQLEVILTP